MDPLPLDSIQTFVSITGASEAVAREQLQAYRGDLNAAINNFFNEGENSVPVMQIHDSIGNADFMEEDEPPASQQIYPPIPRMEPSSQQIYPPIPRMEPSSQQIYPPIPRMEPSSQQIYPPIPRMEPSANIIESGSFRRQSFDTFPASPSRGRPIVSQPQDVRNMPFNPRPSIGGLPIVSQPRDIRDVPIEWKDDEPRVRSRGGLLIEEVQDTENENIPSQRHANFITDEEDVLIPSSSIFRGEREGRFSPPGSLRTNNSSAPPISEIPTVENNEGFDIEQQMLKAAIEASQKDARNMVFPEDQAEMHTEDDDLAMAVSLSLKTAEQEKAKREGRFYSVQTENEISYYPVPEDGDKPNILRKGSSSSMKADYIGDPGGSASSSLPPGITAASRNIDNIPIISVDDTEEYEEQPLRRRPSRHMNELHREPDAMNVTVMSESNGDVAHNEWGGLSTEEQEESFMLERAMFGGAMPDDGTRRFRYPSVGGAVEDDMNGNRVDDEFHYRRPIQQPPSPTVIAQRLLREQQDDEYLASLEADREKEKRRKEEENAEKLREKEELQKRIMKEEIEVQKAAKRAALPEEPPADDDVVNLMVRMPDGSRLCRRFRKSEILQCLFDFIDVNTEVVPGSYRLVRQYPRKAFTDADHRNSLHDLGLSSFETLFLEHM